jgi:hypothetical protein
MEDWNGSDLESNSVRRDDHISSRALRGFGKAFYPRTAGWPFDKFAASQLILPVCF